ncbi:MAG: hypothetical protein IKA19_01670 [Muribaculaceae bacterium]|nr:hypothetical protein [Muribaculaceae bacterium]
MIKLIEDLIYRRKLDKGRKVMLISMSIFFTLFGVYYYFQGKKYNERVEYAYNIALNDSVKEIKSYAKTGIKLWLRGDSILVIYAADAFETRAIFGLVEKRGYRLISKREKSNLMYFSNGIDSTTIWLEKPE